MKTILHNRELRNKILIILGFMILIRLGSVIPLPGINSLYMEAMMSNPGLAFYNMLTGSSLSNMSLFALSITPYITASIILQLLGVAFPSLDEIRKDGKTGQERWERYTIMTGIGLAFAQSLAMSIGWGRSGMFINYTWWRVIMMTVLWTAGAAILMFIGRKITKLELGNGVSYILLLNILSTFVTDMFALYERFMEGNAVAWQIVSFVIIIAIMAVIIFSVVVLTKAERRIPVTYSAKMGNTAAPMKHDLPVPLNTCGVIPVIFTSSILSLPALISTFIGGGGFLDEFSRYITMSYWFQPGSLKYTLGLVIYVALTYAFTLFSLDMYFNSQEIAANLQKGGGMIPGYRPGKPTADYLHGIARKQSLMGTTIMLIIIIAVAALCNLTGVGTLNIGGTSILICVSVILDTKKTLDSAITSVEARTYKKGGLFS